MFIDRIKDQIIHAMFLVAKHKMEGEEFHELLQETINLIEKELLSFRKEILTKQRDKNLKVIEDVFKDEDYKEMLSSHIINKVLFELIKENGAENLN